MTLEGSAEGVSVVVSDAAADVCNCRVEGVEQVSGQAEAPAGEVGHGWFAYIGAEAGGK